MVTTIAPLVAEVPNKKEKLQVNALRSLSPLRCIVHRQRVERARKKKIHSEERKQLRCRLDCGRPVVKKKK